LCRVCFRESDGRCRDIMATCVDLPSAEHLDPDEFWVGAGVHSCIFPTPQLRLRHELLDPLVEGVQEDANGTRFALPVFVRIEVFPEHYDCECILLATARRHSVGRGTDALTVYGAVHRTDFTFRASVFDRFPDDIRRHNQVLLKTFAWNEMSLAIAEHQATYWINGVPVATLFPKGDDIPSNELYFGMTRWSRDFRCRRFAVSRDPVALGVFANKVLTLQSRLEGDLLHVNCISMGGDEVGVFAAGVASSLMPGTQVCVSRETRAHVCWVQPDGKTVYNSKEDSLPLETVGVVRQCFDNGSVSLLVSHAPGEAHRIWTNQLALIPQEEAKRNLRVEGGERVGEFRARVAASLDTLPQTIKLALPDGTCLPEEQDGQDLKSLLMPSVVGQRQAEQA